jgi:hypothetical protein
VWPAMFEFMSTTCSVIFCAIAIKLADDFLDQDMDKSEYNFTNKLGRGSMLYGMLSMAFAASLNASISVSLFFACYIIGMFHDLKCYFPSHLNGFEESILVFLLGVFFWGWQIMLFSIFFVISIQLLDDYIDDYSDQLIGHRNWAHRLGRVECFLLFLLNLLAAWLTDEHLFPAVLLGTMVFYGSILYYQRGRL